MRNFTKILVTTALAVGVTITGLAPLTYAAPFTKQVEPEQDHRTTILQTEQLATQGKAINSEDFAIGTKGQDIQKQWGKPDPESSSEDAYTYSKRNIAFFLSNGLVTHIVSYDKRYEPITYKEVKKTLGEPSKETRGDDGVYTTYECGRKLLVISYYYDKTGKNPDTINQVVVMNQYKDMTTEEKQQYRLKWPSLFK
ncbi:YjgB family protein [Shimazuella sp. AN120528]|nr:YjgB family protein [Shimazuella soli]